MKKFVPFDKLSKKKRREMNLKRQKSWNGLNPVTRKPENPKAYNRRKVQKGNDYPDSALFYIKFVFSYG